MKRYPAHVFIAVGVLLIITGQARAASSCAAAAQSLEHSFDSGASWELCWRVDPQLGLVLSQLAYAGPGSKPRMLLEELHIAGLLVHYDDSATAVDIVSSEGLGAGNTLSLNATNCLGDVLVNDEAEPVACKHSYYRNTLTRYANTETLKRNSVALLTHASIGAQMWSTAVELTEDGMVHPSTALSGRINRFSSNLETGSDVGLTADTHRFASNATLISVWRLDFNIANTAGDDVIDEVQFVSDQSVGVRRRLEVESIVQESRRQIEPANFRGWRISDANVSAATDGIGTTRVGYYLDPQSAGYQYSSNRLNWARFQFFVSNNNPCERMAVGNQLFFPGCGNSLDDYIDDGQAGSAEAVTDPVTWYAIASRFTPDSGDWPVISSRRSSFRLVPFDWSDRSPFRVNQTDSP